LNINSFGLSLFSGLIPSNIPGINIYNIKIYIFIFY
jgi:hypothetical protein